MVNVASNASREKSHEPTTARAQVLPGARPVVCIGTGLECQEMRSNANACEREARVIRELSCVTNERLSLRVAHSALLLAAHALGHRRHSRDAAAASGV